MDLEPHGVSEFYKFLKKGMQHTQLITDNIFIVIRMIMYINLHWSILKLQFKFINNL